MRRKINAANLIGRYRPLIIALSAVVVFVTTYLLILPALTLDEDEAAAQGGIDVPAAAQEAATDAAEDAGDAAEDAAVNENNDAAADGQQVEYRAEDGDVVATATASAACLPEGAELRIREIDPFAEEDPKDANREAEEYSDAMTAVADALREDDTAINGARVFDIFFVDASGREIEPDGYVDIDLSFGSDVDLTGGVKETEHGIAHILDNGDVEVLDADIDEKKSGKIGGVAFSADAFSVYVVFNNSGPQSSEPVYMGNGWIRIGGDYVQADQLPDGTHGNNDEDGWKNYLRINIYTLNNWRPQNSTNPNDYSLTTSFQYLSGYDTITVEDYKFNGNVVFTQFTPADRDMITYNGMQSTYPGTSAFHNWSDDSWESIPNVLNVYVNTQAPPQPPQNRTEYVVRYYHADGTYDEKTGYLTNGQTFSFGPSDKIRSDELYSGLTISAGNDAITANTTNGSGTIRYSYGVPLVKANVYYKESIQGKTAGAVNMNPPYDTRMNGNTKVYDTSRNGLHTDKTASVTANSELNDGRTFDLTLESWNVGTNLANVGMVLDASGSMVWTSDEPTKLQLSQSEIQNLRSRGVPIGYKQYLTADQVNMILDTRYTDNSKLGYNEYRYYIKDDAGQVKEYVPLGYFDGNFSWGENGQGYRTENGERHYYASNEISMAYKLDNIYERPTAGWYYVNSSNSARYKSYGTAKSYCNYTTNKNNGKGTSAQFYINNDGTLHCEWYRTPSNEGGRVDWDSDVYIFPNDGDTKSEVLQNSIARFASFMSALSPESQIAMTRFSRNDFTSAELALLNWTNDPAVISAALNQTYGGGTSTGTSTQYSANGTALNVYNYGFTGNTSTQSGIKAFMDDLTNGQWQQYSPKTTNNAASKYLIIFTDGKDTDGAGTDVNQQGSAAYYAQQLKNNGYTIITVLMQSASMTGNDLTASQNFLHGLAGKSGENGWTRNSDGSFKYYFSAMYDDPEALVEAFQKIAKQISSPLEGYMIRDYIDPRFDIVDSEGNILTQLNPQGMWSPRTIETTDGKRAILKYDSAKGMFYLEIEEQSIPTSPQNATSIIVNSTTITVRAKDDFLGGNDILSNGNEPSQNSVFKPAPGSTIHDNSPTPADNNADRKDYPKTTVNPATWDTSLENYEDTIFLGEDISPYDLYGQVTRDQGTDHRGAFLDYLKRIGKKLHNDPDFYLDILETGVIPQNLPSGVTITPIMDGGTTLGVTMQLPYYYLKDDDDLTSYAGGNRHQADKVGTVTYTWKATDVGGHELTDDSALEEYTSTTTDTVRYSMAISYTPDPFVRNDYINDNGSARTLALTNQSGNSNLIRDPVGAAATAVGTDPDNEGLAAVHVVAGKIKVTKKIEISQSDWNKLVADAGADGLAFTFDVKRNGASYRTVTLSSNDSGVSYSDGHAVISSDWITGLPVGDYTIEETAMPDGFAFDSVTGDTVVQADGDGGANGTLFAAPVASGVVWKIGQRSGGVPAATTYPNTDFTAAKVKDAVKEVDPGKSQNNGKNYLNAQIAKGIVLDTPPVYTDIKLIKTDKTTGESIAGAKFALIKDSQYVDLNELTITKVDASADDPVIETVTVGNNDSVTVVTVPAGGIWIKDLTDGDYVLREISAPAGYLITNGSTSFKIENGEVTEWSLDGTPGTTITIPNEQGKELPHTGGPGTTLLYMLGILLMLTAGIGLVARRRINP